MVTTTKGKGTTIADPQTPKTFIKSIRYRERSGNRGLPQAFEDHGAPKSVRVLFTRWVERADRTDNGVIVINRRQEEGYSHSTVDRAIRWLTAHHLLVRVERGGGRGVGSRFFVRWSFRYPALSTRQKEVNHPKTSDTATSPSYRRNTHKNSLNRTARPPINTAGSTNPHPRARAWAIARIRETVGKLPVPSWQRRELVDAAAVAIDRALKRGQVHVGGELAELVRGLQREVLNLRTGRAGRRTSFSWSFGVVSEIVAEIERARAEAELTEEFIREERAARKQAALHPVGELLEEEGVTRLSDLVRRMVEDEGEGATTTTSHRGAPT